VLHEFEGYTHSELAQLFGQSESYSKSILARALKRLGELVVTTGKETPCPNRT
jgi:RNA polymerase sigma-70 factor (ECF subfamily)